MYDVSIENASRPLLTQELLIHKRNIPFNPQKQTPSNPAKSEPNQTAIIIIIYHGTSPISKILNTVAGTQKKQDVYNTKK